MNAALRAITKVAASRNVRVLGVDRGYEGLVDGQFRQLTRTIAGGLAPIGELQDEGSKGGTMLGTARSPRFQDAVRRPSTTGCWPDASGW